MTRILSGAALVAVAVAAVFLAPFWLFLIIAEALVMLAVWEYRQLAASLGVSAPWIIAGGLAGLACAAVAFEPLGGESVAAPVLMLGVVLIGTLTLMRRPGRADTLSSIAATLFPALYVGLPLGALVAIREHRGAQALFLLMFTIMVSDTAQYYTGRAFGRRSLAPAISPKKTIEGAIGGLIVGTAVLAIAGHSWLAQPAPVNPAALIVVGVLVVTAGIAGDLFESLIKRSAGVKDSSSLIPGHGGILDRIDALLFATPVYFVALKWL